MPELNSNVMITKSEDTKVTVGIKLGFVNNYCMVDCQSYYKRDYLDGMLK